MALGTGTALVVFAAASAYAAYESNQGQETMAGAQERASQRETEATKAAARIQQQTSLIIADMQKEAADRTFQLQQDALVKQMAEAQKINTRTEGRALIQQASLDTMDKVAGGFNSFIKANNISEFTEAAQRFGLEGKFAPPLQQPDAWDAMTRDPFTGQQVDNGNSYSFGNDGINGDPSANLGGSTFPNTQEGADRLRDIANSDLNGQVDQALSDVNRLIGIQSTGIAKNEDH